MTEKDYSGVTTSKIGKNVKASSTSAKPTKIIKPNTTTKEKDELTITNNGNLSEQQIQNYRKAGQIAKQVREYIKQIVKPNVKLVEIAEKIDEKIKELGGELAFPVNLSIDDVAAHYTPTLNDDKIAQGLLKIDFGVHVNGCISDNAISIDLTSDKKYAKLIQASEEALQEAIKIVKSKKSQTTLAEIGKVIQETITKKGFSPIINLSGHALNEYMIHGGITIPNCDNGNNKQLGDGAFAIEPFATTGTGMVYDGSGGSIYHLSKSAGVRDSLAREILNYIAEEKQTLPFSQREIEKKFGKRSLFSISMLKSAGIIEEYPQLIEKAHGIVSQAELSFIISNNKVEVLGE